MRERFIAVSLVLLTLSCGGARAELARERPRCDPASEEHPVEVPYEQTLAGTCGDGRRGQHVLSCVERCSFGCGTERRCATQCGSASEACDGRDTSGATCASLGFASGVLGCHPGCEAYDLSRCEVCADSSCQEIRIDPALAPNDGVELVAAGRLVRAFWTTEIDDAPHLVSATVGSEATLTDAPIDLGVAPSSDVAGTSAGWIAIVDDGAGLVARTIDTRGRLASVPTDLPADLGSVRVLDVGDGALVTVGELNSNLVQVRLLDRRGAVIPLPARPVHAVGGRDRMAIVPLAPGARSIQVGSAPPFAMNAVRGDHLLAWIHVAESCTGGAWCYGGANLLRAGAAPPGEGAVVLDPPALTVAIDHALRVSFSPEGDAIDTTRFDAPPPATEDRAPFPAIVDPTRIARAGGLRAAVFDPDGEGPAPRRFVLGVVR